MLSITEIPKTFREVVGQELVKKCLLKICKEPEHAPHIILLEGSFGLGKTIAAQIFARAINCPHKLQNGDACGDPACSVCGQDINDTIFYTEYDSAIVGNVDSIKELRNTFYFGYTGGYKVIVLDEFQLCSKASQGALLKVFEQPDPNVFFLICTTDPDKLLPTIVSRSLVLCYNKVSSTDIEQYLLRICAKYQDRLQDITEDELKESIKMIAIKSDGHIRNALMLLDKLFILQKDFKSTMRDARQYYKKLLLLGLNYNAYIAQYSKYEVNNNISSSLEELSQFTITELKTEYEYFVLSVTKYIFGLTDNPEYDIYLKEYKNNFKLFNILNDKVIYNLFEDDTSFKIAMFMLIKKLSMIKEK